jgi:hypothetical protein
VGVPSSPSAPLQGTFRLSSPTLLCSALPGQASPAAWATKKTKLEPYSLTAQQSSLIKEDRSNAKLWNEVLKSLKDGPVRRSPGCGPHFDYGRWTLCDVYHLPCPSTRSTHVTV